jgi:lipid II:glycine glycyltransferase (peptidoglycan interpeptide bridge formation enzyme)
VTVEFDRSLAALREFYRLHCATRKRHGVPPQPFLFFRKIHENVLARDLGTVASARFGGRVIASSVFFHFGREAIFKYNASDPRSQSRRPNNLVLWEALRWCKERGADDAEPGTDEADNRRPPALQEVLGGDESALTYRRENLARRQVGETPFEAALPGA